jgi:hypothetical protein
MGNKLVGDKLGVDAPNNGNPSNQHDAKDRLCGCANCDCKPTSCFKSCRGLTIPECCGEHNLDRRTGSSVGVTHTGNSTQLRVPSAGGKLEDFAPDESTFDQEWSIPDELPSGTEHPTIRMDTFKSGSTLFARARSVGRLDLQATKLSGWLTPMKNFNLSIEATRALKVTRDQSRGRAQGRRQLRDDDKGCYPIWPRRSHPRTLQNERPNERPNGNASGHWHTRDHIDLKDAIQRINGRDADDNSKEKEKEKTRGRARTMFPRKTDVRQVRAVHKRLLDVVKVEKQESQASTLPFGSSFAIPLTPKLESPRQ